MVPKFRPMVPNFRGWGSSEKRGTPSLRKSRPLFLSLMGYESGGFGGKCLRLYCLGMVGLVPNPSGWCTPLAPPGPCPWIPRQPDFFPTGSRHALLAAALESDGSRNAGWCGWCCYLLASRWCEAGDAGRRPMIQVVRGPGHLLVERMTGVVLGHPPSRSWCVVTVHWWIVRQDRGGVNTRKLFINSGKGQVLWYHPRVDRRS
jgi:hypothetical protein